MTWNALFRSFFQLKVNALFLIENKQIKGILYKNHFVEMFSNLEEGIQNFNLAENINSISNLDTLLSLFQEYSISINDKNVVGVIDASLDTLTHWERSEVIAAFDSTKYENPTVEASTVIPPESTLISQDVLIQYQLAVMALETFPMAILAIDTNGKSLFFNEEWLFFKKRFPQYLQTQVILKRAKELMIEYALHESINLSDIFTLHNTIPIDKCLYMKFIRSQGKTIGYLFWFARDKMETIDIQQPSIEESSLSLEQILTNKEKEILLSTLAKCNGDQRLAAQSLQITYKLFSNKYNKLFPSNTAQIAIPTKAERKAVDSDSDPSTDHYSEVKIEKKKTQRTKTNKVNIIPQEKADEKIEKPKTKRKKKEVLKE